MLAWDLEGLRPIWPSPRFVFLGFCLWRLSRDLGVMVCGRFGPLLEFGFLGFGFVKVEPCSPGFWEARLLPTYPQGLVLSWSWAHVWFEV